MSSVKSIFKEYAPEYMREHKASIPKSHLKVINAIINCRTSKMGQAFYLCESCNELHSVYRSCGNRHCPTCQNNKTVTWTQKQIEKQLPGHYFLISFTIPKEMREIFRSNQYKCYSALFNASSQSLMKIIKGKSKKKRMAGFWGVIHTWGRTLQYHPHIHYVVPGGYLCKETMAWKKSQKDFFIPVFGLSKIFKAKFINIMRQEGLLNEIPSLAWKKEWNVNCKPAGDGRNVIKYLSRYVFKIAISDSRIVKVKDGRVYFKYRKQRSSETCVTSLKVHEFIRRFLQHVLPSGFMKIRYFGFYHPASSVKIDT